METNERLRRLLEATPEQITKIDAVFTGQPEPERPSLKLYKMGQAAAQTGLSRTTLWRAISEGRLKTVDIRKGSKRIPESELLRFVGAIS